MHFTLLSCLIQTSIEWQGINHRFTNLIIQYWYKMRTYSKINYIRGFATSKSHLRSNLLSGNVTVKDWEISFKDFILYPLTTALKIHLISSRITSDVNCLGFWGNVEEDSLSIFGETLGETFFWNRFKKVLHLIKSIFMLHSIGMFSQGSSWQRQSFVTNCTSLLSWITNLLQPFLKRWIF